MQLFFHITGQHIKQTTMKMLPVSILLLVVTGFFFSCSREFNPESNRQGLEGTWLWARTDGGIADHIHETPASSGNHIEMELRADGRYIIRTNDSVSSEGTYSTNSRKCIHDHKDKPYINFSNDQGFMIERITIDSLYLSDEFFDGLNRVYLRKDLIYPH